MASSQTADPSATATRKGAARRRGRGSPRRSPKRKRRAPRRGLGRFAFRRPTHPWLVSVAVLVVVLLVVECWVRWVKPQLPVQRSGDAAEMVLKARRIAELSGTELDVMFFGTSMVDLAIIPSEFVGASTRYRSAYNASVVGAPPSTQLRWIKEVALVDLEPKLVVVGLHPIDLLRNDPLDLNIDADQTDVVLARVERELRSGPLGALDRGLNDNVELVAQRGSLRQPEVMIEATWNQLRQNEPQPYLRLRDENDWRDALQPDGATRLPGFYDQAFRPTKVLSDLGEHFRSEDFSSVDVNRLLKALKERVSEWGGEIVVLIPPLPMQAWRAGGVDMRSLREGERVIKDLSASFGLDVLDFTDKGYPNELFADPVHANSTGAMQFSHDMVVELETRDR